jgi:hypothetical protein
MEQGYRDADPVNLGVAASLADEERIVEDVEVRERRTLRMPGGPEVYWMLIGSSGDSVAWRANRPPSSAE